MNEYKGRMQTKIELALEQSQQGVSNDVLVQKSVLQPRSSEVEFMNYMLILKPSMCISEKTGIDRLKELRAKSLWDKTISMRNMINLHTVHDDSLLASPKEPTIKSKRDKRPAKKSTTALTAGVVIKDTPGVSVSKKKAPAKADRGKGIELHTSGSSEGADFELEVLDELKAKYSDTSEGTSKKPGVPVVFKANSSNSDDESWGNSEDENDDVNDEDDNDNESRNDADGDNDAQDSKRTNSDEEENPNLNLNVDEEEETQEEEYVHTLDYYVP
nr:hypothetical protein [Tanacetum cinerariifolium]